ncbi:uncharacterized protein [Nothobranchius furzeri]|uniref:uncharacterized protein n=1 Tax=Nothobranchius furzeri TaxID=105023 RepID=UPI002404408B|nr:uncharacterized protein LOC129164962 isoform X2 [Nothobranchius furzeri]
MTTSFEKPHTTDENNTVEALQHEIQENIRQLNEVQQKRQVVEKEINDSRSEAEQRVELMMGHGEVVDALHQLGCLLQEEAHLSELLNDQAASDRVQMSILEDRSKTAADKARSLAAEIQKVKEHLAEIKVNQKPAQAASPIPARKSKEKKKKKQ